MASTSTPTSEASTSYTSHHDVFINHRGPDLKNTFASHLYHRLVSTGLRVFLDKPELVEGQTISSQLEAAIQSAGLHIAIFSPNYAKSKWCLEELTLMKLSGVTILPVFYNVKPSQVRWPGKDKDGPYAEALRNHEENQRYDVETIQKWRDALSAVAEICGFELDAFNGDEGLLLDAIVRRVLVVRRELRLVDKMPLKYVAEHPTGLKEKLQELESIVLLQQKATVVKVVGIVGPGGIGKTTLAKVFFNSKRSDYNRACFLHDIRENADKGSLMSLQRTLLHDLNPKVLAPKEIKYCNIDEGIEKLREHLVSVSALVILDDVDRVSQVEAFLPIKDVLSSNSLILVTSRDKKVLSSSGVLGSAIYNLKGMNEFYSRKLFCCYAFYQPYPLPEFADLVERFLIACDGLPLSLKVFGTLVSGENDRSYWQGILDGLNKTLPTEIQERLKISYDSLSPNEQEVFLDIACFFLKEDRDKVRRVYGLIELRNLENKCLLEVDSQNKVKMHDHIRDLGRHIADQEGLQPRRIWHQSTNNAIDLLDQPSHVITEVRGIVTVSPPVALDSMMSSDMPWYKRWSNEVFLNRRRHLINHSHGILNLQLVATEDGYLERILSRARSPHLIWLRWFKCPYTALPSWIPMTDLRVLEIRGWRLKTLWQRESRSPVQLRELNICAALSRIPKSIAQLKHLEKIVIYDALFTTLAEEFCDLRSLLYLELKGCSKMKSLPDSMGKLTGLQYIDLSCAFRLQSLPSSFGNLSGLRHLSLRDCSNLTISSGTLGNISTLQYLDLSNCSKVKELPPQVAHQRSLENLVLFGTNIKFLPYTPYTPNLCQMERMHLEGNFSLEILPRLRGCLKRLKVLWQYSFRELIYLPDSFGPLLTQLTVLTIEECGIEYLPQNLLEMNNLEKLKVIGCPLRELPFKRIEGERETALLLNKLDSSNDKCMFGLKQLILDGTNISELCFPQGVCPSLQSLVVLSCKELRQIEGLGGLATLQRLEIESCHKIEELHVGECHEIPEMSGVKHPMSLKVLLVVGADKLRSIQGLGQLTKLQSLEVWDCEEIEEVRGVEHVMSLKKVWVIRCPKVQWEGGVVEQLRQRLTEGFELP